MSTTMSAPRIPLAVLATLATIACGPPRLADGPNDQSDTESGETSTSTGMTTAPEPTDEETAEETADATSDFVPDEDTMPDTTCDPWQQDCPPGEKCVPYSTDGGPWNANKCVPIMGDQASGEPCTYGGRRTATDDCDANSACFDVVEVGGELIGTCHTFCTGSPESPECPESSTCALSADGDLAICIPDCDPLAQDCGPEQGCYWSGTQFLCVPSSENLPAGAACEWSNACAVGLICATAETQPDCQGVGCCAPFCNLELGDLDCEVLPGTTCAPFYAEGQAPPAYELVGLCVLP